MKLFVAKVLFLFLISNTALACYTPNGGATFHERFRDSDLVFIGVPLKCEPDQGHVIFVPNKVWKGAKRKAYETSYLCTSTKHLSGRTLIVYGKNDEKSKGRVYVMSDCGNPFILDRSYNNIKSDIKNNVGFFTRLLKPQETLKKIEQLYRIK